MANAAAKKAAAAKAATDKFYKPFLLVTNLMYLVLLIILRRSTMIIDGILEGLCIIATYALQIYAYVGILDQAATTTSSSTKRKELTGGQHLDWLALSLIVQFGSVLHSKRWFWLLFIFPVATLYSLYSAVKGGVGGGTNTNTNTSNTNTTTNNNAGESMTDEYEQGGTRREKRAEKRRKKWS
ncbi:unnamed protein product [Cylindrotheca closterium]|uniref:Transmembrane protein 208 n=1 Tax=Cylindrotheca closterium TaxID=2856 RepID=A0AAD2GCJ6_9STRA|nr:unnamed protein product [Cylindrotheca closterium]